MIKVIYELTPDELDLQFEAWRSLRGSLRSQLFELLKIIPSYDQSKYMKKIDYCTEQMSIISLKKACVHVYKEICLYYSESPYELEKHLHLFNNNYKGIAYATKDNIKIKEVF